MTARRIIVGVDGSASSLAALRWAVETASSLQASVHAVMAYSPTPAFVFAPAAVGALAVATNVDDVRESADAPLVVGHHRHALDSVLGSTARCCVQHATCAVVVVPEDVTS